MRLDKSWAKPALAALALTMGAALAACGGSSNNASPGAFVVGGGSGGAGGGSAGADFSGDLGGAASPAHASIIPPALLGDFIRDSGDTYNGRPIYHVRGGELDPGGLLLGNDAVFNLSGGPLNIMDGDDADSDCALRLAPGAILTGARGTEFLVIHRGCRIMAEGAARQPITFTALAELRGAAAANARGLWGGLVINGYAPINDCPEGEAHAPAASMAIPSPGVGMLALRAGCVKEGEANSGAFGGDRPEDDSGILRYVVVKFAGANVTEENQLNGIAFQGVGSGTEVDYVQVHNNLDDGIEFFGGTVSAKHVVLTGNADDSLDWTDGWTGNIQFLYIQQSASADNAIEADSREEGEDNLPRSLPTIANMTARGRPGAHGLRLRRGTGLHLYNSRIESSATCLRVDGDASRQRLGAGMNAELTFNGVVFGCAALQPEGRDGDGAVMSYIDGRVMDGAVSAAADGMVNIANLPSMPAGFFEDASFIGAVDATATDDWRDGWTVPGSIAD